MYKFKEIVGAILESINESDAKYISANDAAEVLNIQGKSLDFDKGWFVIENPHTVIGSLNLNALIGLKVVDAFSNNEEINLKFENGTVVSVSMKDDDYIGPEAASFTPKQGEIIVFN